MTEGPGAASQPAARALVTLDPAFVVAPVRRRLFGSFVEHMGRCVYTGIYEPGHPSADEAGFRTDVAALIRELGVELIRYPGGNFVSNYHWEDGVGPKADRPAKLDLAWRSVETNQVGTDDFVRWCRGVGAEPMLAVNLGTRGVSEALELLQYCNAEAGTAFSDWRVKNGSPEPHDVRYWCLGNELDGPWQVGHKTAKEYGRLAAEVARAMRRFDAGLELVASGSSSRAMPTFARWERQVLERCFDEVDHISAHAYYEPHAGDVDSFLAVAEDMDRFITSVVATADHVAAVRKSSKQIMISFDEWNVWYHALFPGEENLEIGPAAPLIEDVYDLTDAIVVGSLLITLLRHADRVAIACLAQLVNVIAPIMTASQGPAWRQTIFHPFALTSRFAAGDVLDARVTGPQVDTVAYGPVPQLVCTATHDPGTGDLTMFAVNRSRTEPLELSADLTAWGPLDLVEHLELSDADPAARNTQADPDRVVPHAGRATLDGSTLTAQLPATSWHCLRLTERTSR